MANISGDEQDLSQEARELTENLETLISSYGDSEELSLENLEIVSDLLKRRTLEIKKNELPPVEKEINDINLYIERRRIDLEKAKKSSVFVNDVSDEVEFLYSDHKAKSIEDEIKELLNKRYGQEKIKFKILEELEELEARNNVCDKIIESYDLRAKISELFDYSGEIIDDIYFDIEQYASITFADYESIESWDNNWNIILEVMGKSNLFQLKMRSLNEFLGDIKKQLEEKDPETKFVFDELNRYPDIEPGLQEVTSLFEEKLLTSMAALYELASVYEVGGDYLPENKTQSIGKINKLKSLIINLRSSLDTYKLEYKDFRKTLNNVFVLLNRALQSIENQQKILKNQQETRIKKIKDIVSLISKSSLEALRQSTNELNNMINSLANLGASDYEIESIQYFFSLRAKYPVDESAREEIVDGLNNDLDRMNIMEIDQMCKILEVKYEPRKGIYIDNDVTSVKPVIIETRTQSQQLPKISESSSPTAPRGKTGNLDFLGNMYLKEAQRSKGQWAAKSYLKAIDAFMKCAEVEDDITRKLTFLKQALKAAKDALVEKEDSSTLLAYATAYKALAHNHSSKVSIQGQVKIGDNFVSTAKAFLKEENIEQAKQSFKEAYEAYKKAPMDELVKSRLDSIQRFLR